MSASRPDLPPPGVTHDVDDRPPTPWTRLYVAGMWLARDKDAFTGAEHTRENALELQRKSDAPPTRLTRRRLDVREEQRHGMRTWVVRPRAATPVARVVYLHGGGYVHPLTADYWRLVRALAEAPAEVVVPAYPLAPGADADEVLPRLIGLVRDACADGTPTVLMGDSAGGALTLVIGQRLRGQPRRPARLVMLCPWLDATLDEDEVGDLEATDPMLEESGLRAAGRWWAGPRDPSDPLVSPVTGPLDGLPPLELYIGDHDILRPAVDGLVRRALAAGATLRVREVRAMFHVWMTRAIPEAARTRRQLRELVRAAATDGVPGGGPRGA
ncbi:alpha/beta hydrolase fold domain-containing protein [Nocardioides sp. CPCC 205120]|uniref:alpha/beta hydrolase fold domain-containing protein n=1 Tax=Nocardioides sp. CPCC 205120 TaxID=3406462 RepID=UPI003B50475F